MVGQGIELEHLVGGIVEQRAQERPYMGEIRLCGRQLSPGLFQCLGGLQEIQFRPLALLDHELEPATRPFEGGDVVSVRHRHRRERLGRSVHRGDVGPDLPAGAFQQHTGFVGLQPRQPAACEQLPAHEQRHLERQAVVDLIPRERQASESVVQEALGDGAQDLGVLVTRRPGDRLHVTEVLAKRRRGRAVGAVRALGRGHQGRVGVERPRDGIGHAEMYRVGRPR